LTSLRSIDQCGPSPGELPRETDKRQRIWRESRNIPAKSGAILDAALTEARATVG